ncbi:PREDICTED: uncharacterized protein LOC109359723 [Lupinus angustifolius]|uniref:uncharacterized protein LOC109359723 n=1 Tax=Lupinus angustifolius TaxID=3871 RepID=UPI00092E599C|nr:PREDICTED: uncharacterized protein LOC109359723 [Lupinus angustifolius]
MSSEARMNVLLKVLNQAHVSHDITTDKLGGIVNNIVADNYISFCDEEIPAKGTSHVRPLHISVMCNDYMIGKVLLDNGSSLNVMTKRTFSKLPVDTSYLRVSSMIVKGFDGSCRDVMGEMDLPIKIGPYIFNILFHVIDINPTYSCLLGRPWIHSSGAIPSTLHQKVKFIVDGSLITVSRKEDVMVSQPFDVCYIEVTEEALETSFQGLEIANTTIMIEGAPLLKPYPSDVSLMMAKVMICGGYQPGSGLGKYGQGSKEIIILKANKGRYGLGSNSDSETEGHASAPSPSPDQPVHQVENDSDDEEWEASSELLRLVEQEARKIQPHQEPVELVNLGSEEDKKEVRVGTIMDDWVANVVAVPIKGVKLRICVDYRDLNKASPKDDFTVPHIDIMVDSTADHALFSFMDGYSGYHHIKMAPEDINKTTFITSWGIFCYQVMPFGLKNVMATYQRVMVTLFHVMMHKEIEVYVDDIICKSKT